MKLENKKSIIEDIHSKLENAEISILVNFSGLNVASVTKLRKELHEADVEFKVVKNTLLKRAAENTDLTLLNDLLTGPNAIAVSQTDPVAPAKVLSAFAKDNPKLEIKAGVMNGKTLDLDDVKALADLPSKDVLLGQLLSAMNGVPTALVRALNGVPSGFVNVLNSIKDKKETA